LYDGEIPYEKMREIISTNQTLACLGQRDEKRSLLPDGRFSGQITQNRPGKNISGRKKLVAVRPPIFLKSG
jgi:hypothetical protein